MKDNVEIQPPVQNTEKRTGLENILPNMWKPGQSGNPGGRPRIPTEIKELARDKSRRALERIIELVESDDERVALMAAKELLDRAYGKVRDAEEDDDKRNLTINIVKFADGNKPSTQVEPATVSVRPLAIS